MKRTRLLIMIIAVAMLVSSCASNGTAQTSAKTTHTTASSRTKASSAAAQTKPAEKDFEDFNFGGEVFTFAVSSDDAYSGEVLADENSAESIDKAVVKRNKVLFDYHNCRVAEVNMNNAAIRSDIAANKTDIDFINAEYNTALATGKSFYNFYELDIDVEQFKSSWDTDIIADMAVGGKAYAIAGAFSRDIYESKRVVLFNRDVKKSIPELEKFDFYSMRDDREWTLENFLSIIKIASEASDVCAFASGESDACRLYLGAGQRFFDTRSDSHGFNDVAKEVSAVIAEIYASDGTRVTAKGGASEMMRSGEALFIIDSLKSLEKYTEQRVAFGILPLPKLDPSDSYRGVAETDADLLFAVKTTRSVADVSDFLFIYAKYSEDTVCMKMIEYYAYVCTMDSHSDESVKWVFRASRADTAYIRGIADVSERYSEYVISGIGELEALGGEVALGK